jgi:cyanophycinase
MSGGGGLINSPGVSPARVDESDERGWIVPVGGNEEKTGDAGILRRFVELAGGDVARVAILPTASNRADTGQRYELLFRALGARRADVLPFAERGDATNEDWLRTLEAATGIFLTGGNQLRISTILGGTPVAKAIRRRNARGVVVGGTSAGAAILSEHMIAFGEEGSTPRAGSATLAPGFGLTNRVVIDQHFRQRDRLGRLLSALAYNPFAVGIGLDEDTAAFIDPGDVIEVHGAGAITIVDAGSLSYSSMAIARQGAPVCVTDVRLHVLTAGARYHLRTRTPTPPPEGRP